VDAYDREGKKKLATGVLAAVDNQNRSGHGHREAQGLVPQHDGALFPNQFVNARVAAGRPAERRAGARRGDPARPQGAFVYVVKPDGIAQMRRPRAGPE